MTVTEILADLVDRTGMRVAQIRAADGTRYAACELLDDLRSGRVPDRDAYMEGSIRDGSLRLIESVTHRVLYEQWRPVLRVAINATAAGAATESDRRSLQDSVATAIAVATRAIVPIVEVTLDAPAEDVDSTAVGRCTYDGDEYGGPDQVAAAAVQVWRQMQGAGRVA